MMSEPADVSPRGVGCNLARAAAQKRFFFSTTVVKHAWLHKRTKALKSIVVKNNEKSPWKILCLFLVCVILCMGCEIRKRLVAGGNRLSTEASRNAGMVYDVWTRSTKTQRILRTPKLSFGSKMSNLPATEDTRHSNIMVPKQLVG